MGRLLLVCAGNICRSPMAEALFRRETERRSVLQGIEIGSAGTIAIDGNWPSSEAVAVMRDRFGLDISAHRARRLRSDAAADLLLTVDRDVTEEVWALGLSVRTVLLGDYAGSPGECVEDPYLAPRDAYESCARQLVRLVEAAADRLEQEVRRPEALDQLGSP